MPRTRVTEPGAPKEVGMDAKRKHTDGTAPPTEQTGLPELEVPDEVESWDLDDVMDLLPTGFD
jgi:hypothetical protein